MNMRNKKASQNSNWYQKSKRIFSNYNNKIVLIGIPKCAFNTLRDCLPLPYKYGHYSYDFIFNHHGLNRDDHKVITFTRNPWDRMVSWFFFHKNNNIEAFKYDDFKGWVMDGCKHGSWDLPVSYYHPKNPLNMHEWIDDDVNNIDYIGRVETISEDLMRIGKKFNIEISEIKKLNTSSHKDYKEMYDDESRDRVAEIFAKDIEMFDYKF